MKNIRIKVLGSLAFFMLLFCPLSLMAQQIRVNGLIVDDETNEPLIGVTVQVKGSPTGTISDIDGKYSISVDKNKTLVFTYVGYATQEIKATQQGNINVRLKNSSIAIDDVVVLGTRVKKSDLTGAVGSVTEKQLKEIPSVNLTSAMQGKVAGVYISNESARPGGEPKIKVRGTNSIKYGQDPIYVVDGIIVDQGISMINPNDIASMEVLKDASAKSIYGYKAANGVIVITTKKGKKGEGKISYDGWVGVSTFDKSKMKTLDSRQLFDLRLDAYANNYMDKKAMEPDKYTMTRDEYIQSIQQWDLPGAKFSEEEVINGLANNTTDWVGQLTRTGIQHNHSLSFSNSTDKSNLYLSLSYSGQEGVIKHSSYERFGGKINADHQIKSWLKVGTNTTLSRAKTVDLTTDYTTGWETSDNPYKTAMHGNPMQNLDDRPYMQWQGVSAMGEYNPVNTLTIDADYIQDRILTANYVEVTPIKNLNLRSTLSIDYYNKQFNRYTPKNIGQSVRDTWEGIARQWKETSINTQWDNSVSYETTIAKKHRLFAMATASLTNFSRNSNDMQGYGFPSDDLTYHNMGAAFKKENNSLGSYFEKQTNVSFVQRVNYGYDDRYMLTVSVREDGSSRLAAGNQWGTFPSFSAAWNLTNEKFMEKATDVLNQFKFRVGYGVVGNQNIPTYAYLSLYNSVYSNGASSFISDGTMGNPNIRWEKQKQFNIGFDAGIFNDRLTFGFDYFSTKNTDLLMEMALAPSTGFSEDGKKSGKKIENVAALDNKGVEFSFNAQLIRTKDFQWNFSGNISHDRNEVKKLYSGLDRVWSDNSIRSKENNLFVGQPLNNIWALKVEKIAQESDMERINGMTFADGKIVRPGDILPVDKDGDGEITWEDDMMVCGNKDPKFYGGFSTDLTWKGITLSATFSYSYGQKKLDYNYADLMNGTGTSASHVDILNRWTPTNTNTNIPRAYYGENLSRFGIWDTDWIFQDASYLRCSALTLAYSFPAKLLGKVCSNLRLYATANNLFTITPYKGYDPEGGYNYPTSRMYVFGVNVSF